MWSRGHPFTTRRPYLKVLTAFPIQIILIIAMDPSMHSLSQMQIRVGINGLERESFKCVFAVFVLPVILFNNEIQTNLIALPSDLLA
jgi:hypothetical protein